MNALSLNIVQNMSCLHTSLKDEHSGSVELQVLVTRYRHSNGDVVDLEMSVCTTEDVTMLICLYLLIWHTCNNRRTEVTG